MSNPENLQDNVLLVQSSWRDWGHQGWTATLRRRGHHTFEGDWGSNSPEFSAQPVPGGEHHMVLSVSGEADGWVGWLSNLHDKTGLPATPINCFGQPVSAKFWLT